MNLTTKLFRCSALGEIITKPKSGSEVLSQTAKSAIRRMVIEDKYNVQAFDGTRKTEKGNMLEDLAIKYSGDVRFKTYKKNKLRFNNSFITGEPDIIDLDDKIIIDTKCAWDLFSHPFFMEQAKEKAEKASYHIQQQGYLWLAEEEYGEKFNRAEIDFWLLPCPEELLSQYDNEVKLIEVVNNMPLEDRLTTLVIERDETVIERIKTVVPHAQRYYKMCQIEINKLEI